MDNHPIPQDVTGFEFKLVGNMTIKQFGYVAAGTIFAVIFYSLPLVGWLKAILVLFFSLSGVSIAFIPIEGRPLDQMGKNFFKALTRPNQYVFHKIGGKLSFLDIELHPITMENISTSMHMTKTKPQDREKQEQLRAYLYSKTDGSTDPLDQKEAQLLSSLFSQTVSIQPPHQSATVPESTVYSAQPQVIDLPSVQPQEPYAPPQLITPPPPTFVQVSTPAIKAALQNAPVNMEFSNLIIGSVKDARGNGLPGILVEVKSKTGESVRAFKTNALGQFASATQLPNGEYTIVFEDPKALHVFNSLQVETNGNVLAPIEVVSSDAREELRKSLFG